MPQFLKWVNLIVNKEASMGGSSKKVIMSKVAFQLSKDGKSLFGKAIMMLIIEHKSGGNQFSFDGALSVFFISGL